MTADPRPWRIVKLDPAWAGKWFVEAPSDWQPCRLTHDGCETCEPWHHSHKGPGWVWIIDPEHEPARRWESCPDGRWVPVNGDET